MKKYPAYPKYKDSGVEWIGEVPEEWEVKRLKHLTSETLQYGASEVGNIEEFETKDRVRFIRITDIDEFGFLRDDTIKYLPLQIAKPYLLIEGDILLARSGATAGKSFLYRDQGERSCFAGYLIRFRANTSVYPIFIYYFTQSKVYEITIKTDKIQATIENINAEKYGNLKVALPPLIEQRSIISFLDRETTKIDTLVAKQERMIELLKEKRQALISHAVTKGLDPNVPMKDSGVEWLGEVPEGWEIKRLRFVAFLNPSKKSDVAYLDKNTIVSFLPMDAIGDDGTINTEHEKCLAEVENGYTFFRIGDVAFAKITPCFENGKGAVMKGLLNGIGFGTTELIIARPKPSISSSEYLHWLFTSTPFRKLGESYMYGAGGQKRVPENFVRDFPLAFPSMAEQHAIAAYLDHETAKIDTLVVKHQRMIDLLKEHRVSLISAAVTGKIDVRGEVEACL